MSPKVELLIGGVWTDITSYCMVRDDSGQISITGGIRDEGSQTEQGTAQLQLRNQDGRFSPRNPSGPYYGLIGRNTPIRISVPDGGAGTSYRLWGEVTEWAPNWDTSGNDVWTDVTASGILRRLAQGPVPERSVVYTAITDPLATSVVAYWPMEDTSGATSLASGLTTGPPMTWTGVPNLSSYEGFTASDSLPDLTSAALSGRVADYTDPTATQVRFLVHIPTGGLSDGKVLCAIDQTDYSAGAAQFFELYYSTTTTSNSLVLRTCASDGTVLGAELPHTLDVRGRLLYVSIELQESGTSITRAIRLKDVTTSAVYSVNDTEALTQLTPVTKVGFGIASRAVSGPAGSQFLPGVAVGHCTVENAITAITALGVRLNPIGETAGRRIQRLCGEESVAFASIGDLDDTVALGAQTKQNLLALVQEAALADGGLLYEDRATLGLGYRTRASLYNQTPALTLSYTAYNLAQIPVPVEDDRYVQNKVTVTVGGVSATYEETGGALSTALAPAGVGVYGQELTLNLAATDTATLQDQAAWRVHLGTVNEARFPQISVNLAHPSITTSMKQAILALRLGDRIQVTNPPVWAPPGTIDQLLLGVTETITNFEHRLTFICEPASPYSSIGVLDSYATAIDTDGSVLATAATSTATTLDVLTTAGPVWTSNAADYPFDLTAGGEEVRAAAGGRLLNPNPFFDADLSGWLASNCTITRSTAFVHPQGVASMLVTPNGSSAAGSVDETPRLPVGSIIPGASYVASGWVYSPGGWSDLRPAIDWYDSANTFISSGLGSTFAVSAGQWTFLQQTLPAPSNASRAAGRVRHGGTPPSSAVYYVWGLRITQAKASWLHDSFSRSVTADWGTSDAGLAWNRVGGGAASDYNVGSGYGSQVLSTLDTSRRTAVTAPHADFDIYCDITTSALATGDSLYGGVTARMLDASNMYLARLEFTTGNAIILSVRKVIADVQTQLGTFTLPNAHVAGTFIRVRFQGAGTALKAKAWLASTPEPTPWPITATDSAITAANQYGTRSIRSTGNTNAASVEVRYDNYDVINPQTFTVIRSRNSVVKAQTAATDVRLAHPTIIAL